MAASLQTTIAKPPSDTEPTVPDPGAAMQQLAARLFPLFRSMTGEGVRQSLRILQEYVPLQIVEVPSGSRYFDWEIPQEWVIREAYIEDETGERVVDIQRSNLHVVNGSMPVRARMTWEQLRPYLHTLPQHPRWTPYRTCYFREQWGFCLSHQQFVQLERLGNREYQVVIDAEYRDGSLTYGELLLPGSQESEVLISTHICHPSLANDNLSGIAVATFLAKELLGRQRRHGFRFLFIPATIGAIAWLGLHQHETSRIRHGWVLSVCGDRGDCTYKRSRQGDAEIDAAFAHVLATSDRPHRLLEFDPLGYDQRQFCSPGFNLPMGCFMRTPNGEYPEYHTSADDLSLLDTDSLADSLAVCREVVEILEHNTTYINRHPFCEPPLGGRGLYRAYGDPRAQQQLQQALLWVLNFSDGQHSLLDIAHRSRLSFGLLRDAAARLLQHGLLQAASDASPFSNV